MSGKLDREKWISSIISNYRPRGNSRNSLKPKTHQNYLDASKILKWALMAAAYAPVGSLQKNCFHCKYNLSYGSCLTFLVSKVLKALVVLKSHYGCCLILYAVNCNSFRDTHCRYLTCTCSKYFPPRFNSRAIFWTTPKIIPRMESTRY